MQISSIKGKHYNADVQNGTLSHSPSPSQNYRRVAEVWMDEYAEYLYKRRPHYRDINPGNISDQLAIRKKLNCKPFKWFMEEVAFDLPKKYPPIEPPSAAEGEVSMTTTPFPSVPLPIVYVHVNCNGDFSWHVRCYS